MTALPTIATFIKNDDAVLDYPMSWAAWLGSDTIADAEWTVPSGLTTPKAATVTTTTATVWLGGGTIGEDYRVTCKITTAAGRVDERSILVRVRPR